MKKQVIPNCEEIKKYREKMNWNYTELAEATGISRQMLSNIEKPEYIKEGHTVSLDLIKLIASKLNADPLNLYIGREQEIELEVRQRVRDILSHDFCTSYDEGNVTTMAALTRREFKRIAPRDILLFLNFLEESGYSYSLCSLEPWKQLNRKQQNEVKAYKEQFIQKQQNTYEYLLKEYDRLVQDSKINPEKYEPESEYEVSPLDRTFCDLKSAEAVLEYYNSFTMEDFTEMVYGQKHLYKLLVSMTPDSFLDAIFYEHLYFNIRFRTIIDEMSYEPKSKDKSIEMPFIDFAKKVSDFSSSIEKWLRSSIS